MKRKFIRFFLRVFAGLVLKKYQPLIIAITGNTGKTSTKEAIYLLLKEKFQDVGKTLGNFNTDIGVPLAILGLKEAGHSWRKWIRNFYYATKLILFFQQDYPRFLILELAADHPGEIAYFMRFLPVKIGVVTTIGEHPVHLEFFPTRDRLIREKRFLVEGVIEEGTVILNRDDPDVAKMASFRKKGTKVLFYGKNKEADLRLVRLKTSASTGNQLEISFQKRTFSVHCPEAIGEGHAYAVLAALSCGLALGIDIKEACDILKKYKNPPGRMNLIKTSKGILILDDTYNASPLSTKNALSTLALLKTAGKKIVVLGDMLELGKASKQAHREIGKQLTKVADVVFLKGKNMRHTLKEALKEGFPSDKIYYFSSFEKIVNKLKKQAGKGDIVLVKGSRAMKMEKIVHELTVSP